MSSSLTSIKFAKCACRTTPCCQSTDAYRVIVYFFLSISDIHEVPETISASVKLPDCLTYEGKYKQQGKNAFQSSDPSGCSPPLPSPECGVSPSQGHHNLYLTCIRKMP